MDPSKRPTCTELLRMGFLSSNKASHNVVNSDVDMVELVESLLTALEGSKLLLKYKLYKHVPLHFYSCPDHSVPDLDLDELHFGTQHASVKADGLDNKGPAHHCCKKRKCCKYN